MARSGLQDILARIADRPCNRIGEPLPCNLQALSECAGPHAQGGVAGLFALFISQQTAIAISGSCQTVHSPTVNDDALEKPVQLLAGAASRQHRRGDGFHGVQRHPADGVDWESRLRSRRT